jgi:hypothetical protein
MNMNKRHRGTGETIADWLAGAIDEMDGDICDIGEIVHAGRYGYEFDGNDLREFVFTCMLTLLEHGGLAIVPAQEPKAVGNRIWEKTDRYGTNPVEIAENITAEWIDQGEIDLPGYQGVAFTLPDYLESLDNVWQEPDPNWTPGS